MKILQVAHSFIDYTQAGTEVYTYSLSKELVKRNKVFVFFRVNNPKDREYSLSQGDKDGLKLYSINNTFNQCRSFKETYDNRAIDKVFGELLDEISPDVIHIQHLLFLSLGVVREAKKRKIPVVFTLNDYWLMCCKGQLLTQGLDVCARPDYPRCVLCLQSQLCIKGNSLYYYNILRKTAPLFMLQAIKKTYFLLAKFGKPDKNDSSALRERNNYVKEIISGVDIFLSPSRFLRQKFIDFGMPKEKIEFCSYGLNQDYSEVKKRSGKIRFGYLGTLLPPKGPDLLIQAFNGIKSPDLELLIFGRFSNYAGYEGYTKQLQKLARKDMRIRFMGEASNGNIKEIFSNIDVLVVPSRWPENAPLVIQEAFLSNTPVVASRIGGIPELVDDNMNGLLCKPLDVKDLQVKLEYLINNPDIIKKFKINSPKVKSIEENAREMERIYSKLISDNQ